MPTGHNRVKVLGRNTMSAVGVMPSLPPKMKHTKLYLIVPKTPYLCHHAMSWFARYHGAKSALTQAGTSSTPGAPLASPGQGTRKPGQAMRSCFGGAQLAAAAPHAVWFDLTSPARFYMACTGSSLLPPPAGPSRGSCQCRGTPLLPPPVCRNGRVNPLPLCRHRGVRADRVFLLTAGHTGVRQADLHG